VSLNFYEKGKYGEFTQNSGWARIVYNSDKREYTLNAKNLVSDTTYALVKCDDYNYSTIYILMRHPSNSNGGLRLKGFWSFPWHGYFRVMPDIEFVLYLSTSINYFSFFIK